MGQRIRIKLKAFDSQVIDYSTRLIIDTTKKSKARIAGPVLLPTKIKKYTVLKSPHVNVTARNQYEIRCYKRLVDIYDTSPETISLLMALELPEGLDIQIEQ